MESNFIFFRGNYWDSSNYLSSAIVFNNYEYKDIKNNLYPILFQNFQNFDYIVKARPLANVLLSFLINENISIFLVIMYSKLL